MQGTPQPAQRFGITLNIGLNNSEFENAPSDKDAITAKAIGAAIKTILGDFVGLDYALPKHTILLGRVVRSGPEATAVVAFDLEKRIGLGRPASIEEAVRTITEAVAGRFTQEAVAVVAYDKVAGRNTIEGLYGSNATKWRPFNPQLFYSEYGAEAVA